MTFKFLLLIAFPGRALRMVDCQATGPGGDIPYPKSLQATGKGTGSQAIKSGVFLGLTPPPALSTPRPWPPSLQAPGGCVGRGAVRGADGPKLPQLTRLANHPIALLRAALELEGLNKLNR